MLITLLTKSHDPLSTDQACLGISWCVASGKDMFWKGLHEPKVEVLQSFRFPAGSPAGAIRMKNNDASELV